MNEHDLFLAIGGADDAYLTETKTKKPLNIKRTLWRVGLVAALISVLAVTVSAAPYIISALSDGTINWTQGANSYVSIYGPGAEGIPDPTHEGYEVVLEIDRDTDAPDTLATPRIPTAILGAESYHCRWAEYGFVYWSTFELADGESAYVRYEQYTIPADGNGRYYATCRSIPGGNANSRTYECGGTEVMEVTFTGPLILGKETRQLYWSDGQYIYYLLLDYDVPETVYEGVITSLQDVADAAPALLEDAWSELGDTATPTEG